MVMSFVSSTGWLTVWPALPEEECKQTGGPTGFTCTNCSEDTLNSVHDYCIWKFVKIRTWRINFLFFLKTFRYDVASGAIYSSFQFQASFSCLIWFQFVFTLIIDSSFHKLFNWPFVCQFKWVQQLTIAWM